MMKCEKPGSRDGLPCSLFEPGELGDGLPCSLFEPGEIGLGASMTLLWSTSELGNTCTSEHEQHLKNNNNKKKKELKKLTILHL